MESKKTNKIAKATVAKAPTPPPPPKPPELKQSDLFNHLFKGFGPEDSKSDKSCINQNSIPICNRKLKNIRFILNII